MSKPLVECVPNFSEGRDPKIIEAITNAIKETPGCTLLDVDPGKSTNRTVVTFVGDTTAIVNGAFNATKVAFLLIDMTKHQGAHPRMGALDVCPFVPVRDVTMEDCIECAKQFGKRCADELGLPIFLYEEASNRDYRKQLKQIRNGEYEGLEEKLKDPKWAPDFGPAKFIPSYGASVTGARNFLIAYNVNVLGTKEQAHRIALNVREAGRSEKEPGRLKMVKGIGWYVDEYNMAQVSMNLDNYKVTAVHTVFEECSKDARELNLAVTGSEIVGLVPLDAILMAADYYIKQENLFIIDEGQKVRLAINRLGLSACSPFDPKKRIIDYMVQEDLKVAEPLASMTVRSFIEIVGARTTAPGGGSVAANIAALGSALGAMAGWMTYGKKKFEDLDSTMRELIPPLDNLQNIQTFVNISLQMLLLKRAMKDLIPMIDADTKGFNEYVESMSVKGPQRDQAVLNALKKVVNIPLNTMRISNSIWPTMLKMAECCNINSKSDFDIGVKALELGVWGALQNVNINLVDMKDEKFKAEVQAECKVIWENTVKCSEKALAITNSRSS
ncbi:formimidoyltransferase-cyclodeaminase [Heterostelium album PN500]|uniref:Formimidoyltransferase-cyclodeaminase n=1 Tax=Heterostelium pallidum (strain ATCC 26659 / Pp 5 / PN500) TaxID=670386 RepID=D3BQY2_HETP5|nr:formimidoyltransferase-cyclodeaminase [Heterostelium album PN500]EFA76168.1 formimidoyltransferase-cyclodeaminase [Heterostelium album PN500]|eukprot:XP_020428302.1 formimidoyltransferase-cyclodeaminase [Heterostelium album PN500]